MSDLSKITLPNGDTYDLKDPVARTVVTQTATTTNANYEVLFSSTADNTTRTEGARKNSNLTFNPSTGNLTTTQIGGKTVDELVTLPQYEVGTPNQIVQTRNNFTRPNRLVFLPPDQVIIEQTTDGGTTWTDAGVSDAAKANLFSGINDGSVPLPLLNGEKSTNCGIRITFTAIKYDVPEGTPETQKYQYWNKDYYKSAERYCSLELLWFWLSSNSDAIRIYAYRANGGSPNNWITLFNTDFPAVGWSGSDWISFSYGTFGGGKTQTGQAWNYKLEFYSRLREGKTEFQSTTQQYIQRIFGYGQNCWTAPNRLMQIDHLYYWDSNKNATFPANISATNFIGNLTGNVSGTAANVTGTIAIANGGTGATTAANARSNLGLGNVENKSSATIRGELTKSNVTTALGYTPYTPAEVDALVSAVFHYKGTKATFAEVQALTGMKTGDVWQVTADNSEYVYNGTTWEKLGPTIDLSGYLTSVSIAGQTLTPSSNSITVAQLKTALGLKAAAYVDTESTLANDAKLPTGAAVKSFVEGKGYVTTDTKNTAGSTDTSSKIFLIGATSQAANPQTYSDNEVYATSGVLTTKSTQVGGGAVTMEYNSTTQSLDFIFA